jgi:membrane-associated HD superfamily phosphohydrolase
MHEELTNEELIQLYDVVTGSVNAQFELWLTITFAVIIASYLAGHRLARSLQYLMATLYTAVSVLLYLMLLGAVQFSQQFDALNFGASSGSNVVLVIAVLRTSVWILGTIATIVFIFKGHKGKAGNDA